MNLEYRVVLAVGVAERRGLPDQQLIEVRDAARGSNPSAHADLLHEIDAFINGDATEDADILAVASVVQPIGSD